MSDIIAAGLKKAREYIATGKRLLNIDNLMGLVREQVDRVVAMATEGVSELMDFLRAKVEEVLSMGEAFV